MCRLGTEELEELLLEEVWLLEEICEVFVCDCFPVCDGRDKEASGSGVGIPSIPIKIAGRRGGKYSPGIVPMPKIRVTPRPPLQNIRQGKNRRARTSAPLESLVVYTWFVVTPAIVLSDEVETAEKMVMVGNPGGTRIAPDFVVE